jgi:hypothetical protein
VNIFFKYPVTISICKVPLGEENNGDGSQNVGFVTVKAHDMAGSPTEFYCKSNHFFSFTYLINFRFGV